MSEVERCSCSEGLGAWKHEGHCECAVPPRVTFCKSSGVEAVNGRCPMHGGSACLVVVTEEDE